MFCEQCGSKLQPTFKFCNSCGSSIFDVKLSLENNTSNINLSNEKVNRDYSIDDNSNFMKLVSDNNLTTAKLIILTIATGGVYSYIYIWHLQKIIVDKFHPDKNLNKIVLIYICMLSWSTYVQFLFGDDIRVLAGILTSFAYGFWVYWSIQVRKILEDNALYKFNINLRLNIVYTVIFGIYYFCYCINDLENIKKREDYLKSVNP
jgi:hypothetical protein